MTFGTGSHATHAVRTDELLAPGAIVGDWRIVRRIGQGGMSVVYAAVHALIGKRAAIKVIRADLQGDPAMIDRFVQEARIVNELAHPTVIDIFHVGWLEDGRIYLVMELLIGKTLVRWCKDGPPSRGAALARLAQLCEPLAVAHARGVVHRDLKPPNVVFVETRRGSEVKLLDWGLATRSGTAARGLVGTPRYMAPEQARARAVDVRADIYALGVLAYELLLGRAPFEADDVGALVRMQVLDAPPPPRALWPSIPRALEALLGVMLAKDPEDRPLVAEVRAALTAIGRSMLGSTRAADEAPPPAEAADDLDAGITWNMPVDTTCAA